jgi:Mlo family
MNEKTFTLVNIINIILQNGPKNDLILYLQMGSHMKRSIFDEHTSKALKKWHHQAVVKTKATGGNPNTNPRGSSNSPSTSPPRASAGKQMQRMQSKADRGIQLQAAPSRRRNSYNDQEITDEGQTDAAAREPSMVPVTDLLTGSVAPQQQGSQQQQRHGGNEEDYQFVKVDF